MVLQKPAAISEDAQQPPSWVRSRVDESPGSSNFGSPVTRRKINQSPKPKEEETEKYRSGPQAPFQPGFYKPPALEEPQMNPFPLSPKVGGRRMITKEKSSESIASNSSSSKKMRRKLREQQRAQDSDSDTIYDDQEV